MHKSFVVMVVNKIYHIFKNSYKKVYIYPFILSCIIYSIYSFVNPKVITEYMNILNAIGILSTFYLFGMEKLDIISILKTMRKELPMKKNGKTYTEGVALVETYYALLIIQVLLLATQYILFIFNIELIILLIMSVVYMLMAFLFSIACWHGYVFLNR